nr:uncharacterized protein LOC128691082 isoform X2 [Cherax quadricarinatus]
MQRVDQHCQETVDQQHTGKHRQRATDLQQAVANNQQASERLQAGTAPKTKLHRCQECQLSYPTASGLTKHMKIHNPDKPYKCQDCDKKFVTKSGLDIHKRNHTGERPYKCTECTKAFTTRSVLIMHMRGHTGEKPYECNICHARYTQSATLADHMRRHTGVKQYQCSVCKKEFITRIDYRNHIKVCHGTSKFKCTICHTFFPNRNALQYHTQMHTCEKPYECAECGKKFAAKVSLSDHITIKHSNEKSFKCDICSKCYATNSLLRAHVYAHRNTGVRCECGINIKSARHILRHQNGIRACKKKIAFKEYLCTICGRQFDRKITVKNHARKCDFKTVHISFFCDFCHQEYKTFEALVRHLIEHCQHGGCNYEDLLKLTTANKLHNPAIIVQKYNTFMNQLGDISHIQTAGTKSHLGNEIFVNKQNVTHQTSSSSAYFVPSARTPSLVANLALPVNNCAAATQSLCKQSGENLTIYKTGRARQPLVSVASIENLRSVGASRLQTSLTPNVNIYRSDRTTNSPTSLELTLDNYRTSKIKRPVNLVPSESNCRQAEVTSPPVSLVHAVGNYTTAGSNQKVHINNWRNESMVHGSSVYKNKTQKLTNLERDSKSVDSIDQIKSRMQIIPNEQDHLFPYYNSLQTTHTDAAQHQYSRENRTDTKNHLNITAANVAQLINTRIGHEVVKSEEIEVEEYYPTTGFGTQMYEESRNSCKYISSGENHSSHLEDEHNPNRLNMNTKQDAHGGRIYLKNNNGYNLDAVDRSAKLDTYEKFENEHFDYTPNKLVKQECRDREHFDIAVINCASVMNRNYAMIEEREEVCVKEEVTWRKVSKYGQESSELRPEVQHLESTSLLTIDGVTIIKSESPYTANQLPYTANHLPYTASQVPYTASQLPYTSLPHI